MTSRREMTLWLWFEITIYHMPMIAYEVCMKVFDWTGAAG